MTKRLNIFLVMLFVWGLVIAPAVHRLAGMHGHAQCAHGGCPSDGHSHPERAGHDVDHCSICHLAHAPMLASAPVVLPVPETSPVAVPVVSFLAPAVSASYRLPFSCGPPT